MDEGEVLQNYFDAIWVKLDSAWTQAKPKDVMAFPGIWKGVQEAFVQELEEAFFR